MDTLIDFSDRSLRTFLPVLLQDHTTGENIIWATDPPPELGVGFADVISWNVWQMDGLKKTVPGTDIPCKIKDWKADKEILFKDVWEDK